MTRISKDEWGLRLAEVTALRGTCLRRRVGCVLVDARGVVLATGFNGVARGAAHCNEAVDAPIFGYGPTYPNACPGATAPSGTQLDACQAIHAECNACLWCHDVMTIDTCYTTVSPCVSCTKMLLNTGCRRIVFREPYPHPSEALWVGVGRAWVRLSAA